jgi:LPXTG-motif cell wall-anchored protein
MLPNTGGNRVVFWVAVAALAIGLITLAISGAAALKQRLNQA